MLCAKEIIKTYFKVLKLPPEKKYTNVVNVTYLVLRGGGEDREGKRKEGSEREGERCEAEYYTNRFNKITRDLDTQKLNKR